ncbi:MULTISPECIES: hypothetical protein [Streptomyces]|uniref:hypothetical protein n=1 Tax=Streptomyces TaxID=1883 RepID=UPI0022490805|nr:hypothetical protein [Streptomyces sp. JHD 1]MCX2971269.1 hypothetical protein [Streptomyces sp. JHD 1]
MIAYGDGPTEVAGTRTIEAGGYHFLFYPDVGNPTRRPGCQASTFYWMPDRLHLARHSGGYDFSFTRYARLDSGTERDVCGMVRFTLAADIPQKAIDDATHALFEQSPKSDPYWGSGFYHKPAYVPLTFSSTHTTLSDVAARAERTLRRLGGGDPWYCEKQGADTGPLQATARRTYTTLLGHHYTELVHRALVENSEPLSVNRTMGIRFTAPVRGFTMDGDWADIHAELRRHTTRDGHGITLDRVDEAVGRLRSADRLAVDCDVDPSVPTDPAYRESLLHHSGCASALFLELARGAVLGAPAGKPTALAADAEGEPNPWGRTWHVPSTAPHLPALASRTEVPFTYLRPITFSTRFTDEFAEIRAEPRKYFFTRYPDDEKHTLHRVFRPVLTHEDPSVASLSVRCGYPDAAGRIVWAGKVFEPPTQAGESPANWNYTTRQRSLDEVADPPAGWAPDTTFVRRQVTFRSSSEATSEHCVVVNDLSTADIDPGEDGQLLNDVAIDVAASMAPGRLDVYPIHLHRRLGAEETVEVRFEATDDTGRPDGKHTAQFRWEGARDTTPRRWIVNTGDRRFPGSFRYRVTVRDGSGTGHRGPWLHSSNSGVLHLHVLRQKTEGDERSGA